MAAEPRDGKVQVIDGKKTPLCRKTACYKFALFLVAVVLSSLILSCVVVVVLRGQLMSTEKVSVQVGNLELLVKKDVYDRLMEYFDKIDVNRNQSISLETALAYFDSLDTDDDRILTCKEMDTGAGEQYKFIFEAEDIDGDNTIRRSQIGDIHNRVDIDDNGAISREEFVLYHELARRALHDRQAI